jgi:hypothetical protein
MLRSRGERPLVAAVGIGATVGAAVTVLPGRKVLPLVGRARSPWLRVAWTLAVRRARPLAVLGTRPLTREVQLLRAGFLAGGSALT